MTDIKEYTNREFLDFFQSGLKGMSPESRIRYRKTLSEFDVFLTGHHLNMANLSDALLTDWVVELLYRGLSANTVARHLNHINSLVKSAVKKGMLAPNNDARVLSRALENIGSRLPSLMYRTNYDECLSILKNALKEDGVCKYKVYVDMLLLSLLNGAISFNEILYLKRNALSGFRDFGRTIIERNIDSRRDYVFDLKQSYLTPKQLKATVASGLYSVFGKYVNSTTFEPDDFARSLWVACAIRSGLTASEALRFVNGPTPYALPDFCKAGTMYTDRDSWIDTINSILFKEMPKWYAMHLRKGVKFDELRREITEKIRPCPELFYPCETIMKHRNGKMMEKEQPLISRTAFFKNYPENVLPMFSIIGDKAWCYRVSGTNDSPFAVIPWREMKRFQSAIGVFTPDSEISPLGQLTPRPGESVIVVMAGLGNRTGEVEQIVNKQCGSVIFRVKLTTDQGYEFRVDVDSRQIERILED